jgi:primosomal protein N' (replication factor Y)
MMEPAVIPSPEPDLFGSASEPIPPADDCFAEVVFDRPVTLAYQYAVPLTLVGSLEPGKRVRAPFGRGDKPATGFCVAVHSHTPERVLKALQAILDPEPLLSGELLELTQWMAEYYLCGWGQVLNAVIPAGAKSRAGTRAAAFVEILPESSWPEPFPDLSAKQQTAFRELKELSVPIEMNRLARLAHCGKGPIEALVTKKLARRLTLRTDRADAELPELLPESAVITLNEDQLRAWAEVENALRRGEFGAYLLHGVTGSGKTEIYLRAIEEVIREGKQAIMLVPEISLTPQTIHRFQNRFGEVAVLHSHLGSAERGKYWRRIASGELSVVVGARSAIFAPSKLLGLIVIDEEHEGSFKQEATPRYHARDVAVMRARKANIPILLGSATPSLESWYNAQRGQYQLLSLPKRVLDRPLPRVSLIDLRQDAPVRGRFGALSLGMERALKETLRTNGQVMLLLNRRGYSTHVHCPSCGHVEKCRFCDLALTHHRQQEILLCHCCGYEAKPLDRCPKCGKYEVRYQGLGTEKLQTELEAKFPGYVIRRMDSDSMKRPGSHGKLLAAFRSGLVHILVGTQMIAKGFDFPNVTLVGVINADLGLNVPDFRSSERTFQLLSQVAGRTGRGERGGKVLIQTYNPEHPCIEMAARHDFLEFARTELAQRQAHGYPPFERLVRIIVRSKREEDAGLHADRLANAFRKSLEELGAGSTSAAGIRLLGPAEAPVFRLKGYYRFHFQLQSASSAVLHQTVRGVLPALKLPRGVECTVDVDPVSML